jgi:hypothetical protein
VTLEDIREFLEEYRYLHRNDGDGGIMFLLELVAVRDRMDAETRAVFDQLLVALIWTQDTSWRWRAGGQNTNQARMCSLKLQIGCVQSHRMWRLVNGSI